MFIELIYMYEILFHFYERISESPASNIANVPHLCNLPQAVPIFILFILFTIST